MQYNIDKDLEYLKIINNLNDDDLADYCGITRMTLNRWRKNDVIPAHDSLERIYNAIYSNGIYLNKLKEEMYVSSAPKNHIVLFHGAKSEIIGEPSIKFSEEKKDFGKGFYLGESFNQSASFVIGYESSSVYIFDFDKTNVKIKEYDVGVEWMLLIAYFRNKISDYSNSTIIKRIVNELKNTDVVIAPIADNTMYTILDDFIRGIITDLQCLNALSANRLGKQYVFLNNDVINSNLKMLERCFLCEKERMDFEKVNMQENSVGKNKVKIALREYAGKGKYIEDLLYEKA